MARATPASLRFRWPAEWEPHAATWLAWPHNRTDWPGKFGPVPWVYAEIVRALRLGEAVRIIVRSKSHEIQARRVLAKSGIEATEIEFLRCQTNRSWIRDSGPIFITRTGPPPERAVARFHFNAWARYRDWRRDDRVPEFAARHLRARSFEPTVHGRGIVLEGGSIDGNGRGTIVTTEECLLDQSVQVRNPGLSRADLERVLHEYLGARTVLWLGKGIVGDDTHGHVDDVCRFAGPRTVVVCRERNPRDGNYRHLEENRERLQGMRTADGETLEVVDLPMPAPRSFGGQRLPASYANFYAANAAVLVPTFNDPNDRVALGILAEVFDRPVVGIHAVDLVLGLGTLHCLTQQEPASGPEPGSPMRRPAPAL